MGGAWEHVVRNAPDITFDLNIILWEQLKTAGKAENKGHNEYVYYDEACRDEACRDEACNKEACSK